MKDLLVGQILWVQPQALIPVAILYLVALAAWFGLRNRIGQIGFYVLFALVVTQSVQLVGIYLVFTSLIIPALASRRFDPGKRLVVGYLTGLIGYMAGIWASYTFDLPTGAVIVVTLLLTLIGAILISPKRPPEVLEAP